METAPSLSIFITGATNFVGRAVTRYLVAHGHRVTGMTVGADGASKVRADGGLPVYADPYRPGEIKSILRMAQADVVLHLTPQAANHIPHRRAEWDERMLTEGTAALLDAAAACGVKRVVYPSFAFLYGDTGGEWVDESAPRQTPGDDAIFAALTEAEDLTLNSGLGCVLRCGYAYGSESEALHALVNSLRAGRPVISGSAAAYSNWVHVDDLAQALMRAASAQAVGEIFNIADDAPCSPAEFLRQFAAILGPDHTGGGIFGFLARPSRVQSALLNTSVRLKNDKAKQKLGWTPKYPTQQQGIEQILLNWRAGEKTLI